MNKETENNSDIILPIICPGCGKEINLGVGFELLPLEEDEKKEKNDIAKGTKTQ